MDTSTSGTTSPVHAAVSRETSTYMQHLPAVGPSEPARMHCRDLSAYLSHYRRTTTESSHSPDNATQPHNVSAIGGVTYAALAAKHVRNGPSRFLKQAGTAPIDNKIQRAP